MKKLIIIFLAAFLCLGMFISCGKGDGDSSSVTEGQSTPDVSDTSEPPSEASRPEDDPYTDSEGRYVNTNEVIDWEEGEFSIIVRGKGAGTYQSDDFTTGSELYGDLLDTAVTERNNKIEAAYNVKLKIYKSDSLTGDPILNDIRTDISTNSRLYDAVMPTIAALSVLAAEGNLLDLNTLPYIKLEAPWWDASATKTFSVANKVYFTTGDITILNKVNSKGMLFSKEIVKNLGLDDPYALVKDHKWTYEKMKQMAKSATVINNKENVTAPENTWGMLASYNDALDFYGSAGQLLCAKDPDDFPYLVFGDETTMTIAQKIIDDMLEKNTWVVYAQNFEPNIWVTSLDAFIEGRILFRPSVFSATTKLRIAGADFGVLPMPLWNEDQDDYFSYCGTGETAGLGISIGCDDPDFSAYMVEAIACESKNIITPAYVELNLKSKDMQDNDSYDMLEIIFSNIVYDTGEAYDFGGLKRMFSSQVESGRNTLISDFDTKKQVIDTAIDDLIDSYLANQN